jgi:hypothetical protein
LSVGVREEGFCEERGRDLRWGKRGWGEIWIELGKVKMGVDKVGYRSGGARFFNEVGFGAEWFHCVGGGSGLMEGVEIWM